MSHRPRRAGPSRYRLPLRTLALAIGVAVAAPAVARAQGTIVPGGDFDIGDNLGTLRGNTAFLTGRSGFGTDRGTFVLVNANNAAQDVDADGYTPGVNFTHLVVSDTTSLIDVANPANVILKANLVIADFLNPLNNGAQNQVAFYVNIPDGTPAGTYKGRITIRDQIIPIAVNANGEALAVDGFEIQVTVLPKSGVNVLQADRPARADSVVIRGRPGQSVTGVFRVANLGNIALTNVRFDRLDLVSSSGTGLRIAQDRIAFSPEVLTAVGLADSSRVTITVRIPPGLLAGPYRGDLIVQADGVSAIRLPLTVVVSGAGEIVFENNPVRGRNGDDAVIIFNGDPGTEWKMRIFDMLGVTVFAKQEKVFSGVPASGGNPATTGDQAVRFVWPLRNGHNELVAGGMYLVIVQATQDGKPRQMRAKLMVIR